MEMLSNNWYKNFIAVTVEDYKVLKAGKIKWQKLNLKQEYIEYENKVYIFIKYIMELKQDSKIQRIMRKLGNVMIILIRGRSGLII